MSFADKTLTCRDCGTQFVFTAGEQEFYAQKGFTNEPTRCGPCRQARKQSGGGRSSGGYSDRDSYGGSGGYSDRDSYSSGGGYSGQYSGTWSGSLLRPASGRISSSFGMRVHPITGRYKLHTGVDVAAPSGAPIRAADKGLVDAVLGLAAVTLRKR